MRATIGLILLCGMMIFIGYTIGEFTAQNDSESGLAILQSLQRENDLLKQWCDDLVEDNKRFMKYVPMTERKRDLIISLHNKGFTGKQIGEVVGLKKNTVNVALRRWGVLQKKNGPEQLS